MNVLPLAIHHILPFTSESLQTNQEMTQKSVLLPSVVNLNHVHEGRGLALGLM